MNTKSVLSLLSALGAFMLSSCTFYQHQAAATPQGNYTQDLVLQGPGGTISTHGSDGSSMVADNQQSLRDAATAAVGIAGTVGNYRTNVSNNKLEATKVKANTTPVPQQIVPEGSIAVPPIFPPKQ